MWEKMLAIRGELMAREKFLIEMFGGLGLVLLWWAGAVFSGVREQILPSPVHVVTSLPELWFDDALLRCLAFSVWINFLAYLEAIALALPLGFVIGLFLVTQAMFERPMSSSRFMPIPALIGVFILWFGIETNLKVQFLALGIFVYLLPVVAQRVRTVPDVYLDTVFTLGATKWQTVKSVHIPNVMSRVFDDIRVLVAISWTYITVIEPVNMSQKGIGVLFQSSARAGRTDKVFALLAVVALIGFLQDRLLFWADRKLFKFKYA